LEIFTNFLNQKIEKTKTLLTTQVPPAVLHTIISLLGRESLTPWIQTKPIMPENP
jgi:hypothetical protein